MMHKLNGRGTRIVVLLVAALMVALFVAGCGDKADETKSTNTAISGLETARSALSTTAPDAKLLLVQTAQSVTGTATPVWAYLFGSPSTDKTYVVYVADGKVMSSGEYGTAGLAKDEWPKVPDTKTWEIDSDAAYTKAFEASKMGGKPGYSMGMITYIPESEATATTSAAFMWYVSLTPDQSGDTTKSVQVDAKSGEATVKE